MKILLTGTAGFIGFHAVAALVADGHEVVGLDVINDYYAPQLKYDRLSQHGLCRTEIEYAKPIQSKVFDAYRFVQLALEDTDAVRKLMQQERFDAVVHLAAQAGLKNCFDNPGTYITSNMTGFFSILEGCRLTNVGHFVFASSSSVYGLNESIPFSEDTDTSHPASLYGASKKANEVMAHSYAHLFGLPCTATRFFTVYGPWGRPDMVCSKFATAMLTNQPIRLHGEGKMWRDFTYVGDIVETLRRIVKKPAQPNPDWQSHNPKASSSSAPFRVYNVGCSAPVLMTDFVTIFEEMLGKKAIIDLVPVQAGEISVNHADVSALRRDFDYTPNTNIREGLRNFADWFLVYNAQNSKRK